MNNQKFLFLFILLICFCNGSVHSQTLCPQTLGDHTWKINQYVLSEALPTVPLASAFYDWRVIGGRLEIKVDWSTLTIYNLPSILNEEERKGFIIVAILKNQLGICNWMGNKEVVFYDEVSCKVTKNCYLKENKVRSIYCADEHWTIVQPEIFVFNNSNYWKISSTSECNVTCCETIYQVYCYQDTNGDPVYKIASKSSNIASGANCEQNLFYDCLTQQPIHCESNCQ